MNKDDPASTARRDWAAVGEFNASKFQGEQRRQYEQEAARIERQFDSQKR